MKAIVIVNGLPRAGKDSTVSAMTQILEAAGVATMAISSIDPVRGMLAMAGIDVTAKTPADRALLAEVGDSVERHSQFRSRMCADAAQEHFFETGDKDAAIFLHVREGEVIDRICNHPGFKAFDARAIRVCVISNRAEKVTSNSADSGVHDQEYHATIENNGTLDDLARSCDKLLFRFGLIQQLSLLH